MVAQPLIAVVSVDLATDEVVTISEASANVRVRKAPRMIAAPATTEELRQRLMTLAITFMLAKYKHGNRLWLRTCTLEMWRSYIEFLLSEEVAGFNLDAEGLQTTASWATVLSYEPALRKRTVRSVLYDNLDIAAAFQAAKTSLSTKERYFITPTAIGSRSSAARVTALPPGKGAGKNGAAADGLNAKQRKALKRKASFDPKGGAGKGTKGKGAGKFKPSGLKTPDGRLICDYFNTAAGCKNTNCKFIHVCSACYKGHGFLSGLCAAGA